MNDWTKAYVTVGEMGVFPAEVAAFTWNGAACPRFTKPVAEQIMAAITARNSQPGYEDNQRLEWDGDVIVETNPAYADQQNYPPERIEPDEDGMYPIGFCSWTWSEVWCDGDAHAGEADDLVIPVAIMKQVKCYTLAGAGRRTVLLDQAYCAACLERARAAHPQTAVTMLPPL